MIYYILINYKKIKIKQKLGTFKKVIQKSHVQIESRCQIPHLILSKLTQKQQCQLGFFEPKAPTCSSKFDAEEKHDYLDGTWN